LIIIAPGARLVGNALESAGFAVRRDAGLSGMVRLVARRL
jgi:hypothetical protein